MRSGVAIGLGVIGMAVLAGIGLLAVQQVTSTASPPTLDGLIASLPAGLTLSHGPAHFNLAAGTADLAHVALSRGGKVVLSADMLRLSGIQGLGLTAAPRRIGHVSLINVGLGAPGRHVGRIEMTGLSAETLRQILSADAYPQGRAAWSDTRPVIDALEMFDLAGRADAPPGQTGKLRLTGTDFTVAHAIATGITARQLQTPPSYSGFADPAAAADLALAVGEAASRAEKIQVNLHGVGTLTVASIANGAYAGGKLAAAEITDTAFTPQSGAGGASLHQFSVTGVDCVRLLAEIPAALAAQQANLPPPNISGLMRLTGMTVAGLNVDLPHGPKITMESLVSHVVKAGDAVENSTTALRNLVVAFTGRDVAPELTKQLDQFGMQDFAVDADAASSTDLPAGRVAVTKDDVTVHGLGVLHLTFALENYFPGTGTAEEIRNRVRQARLIHASLGWDDASLTGRLLKIEAARIGKPEKELRGNIAKVLVVLPRLIPRQPDAADQITAFLDGQHSISFTMEPSVPVSLGEIGGAPATDKASMLGLRIAGN